MNSILIKPASAKTNSALSASHPQAARLKKETAIDSIDGIMQMKPVAGKQPRRLRPR